QNQKCLRSLTSPPRQNGKGRLAKQKLICIFFTGQYSRSPRQYSTHKFVFESLFFYDINR
ncbi:unnamed protein product, partial [Tetraodon nigroviridis]